MRRALLIAFGVVLVGVSGAAQKAAPPAAAAPARITTPKQEFGHNFGDDYFLAHYQQISAYWKKLETESPRIKLQEIGKTADGRMQLTPYAAIPELWGLPAGKQQVRTGNEADAGTRNTTADAQCIGRPAPAAASGDSANRDSSVRFLGAISRASASAGTISR